MRTFIRFSLLVKKHLLIVTLCKITCKSFQKSIATGYI